VSFAIPRKDFGAGVTVVGTTDGPTGRDPAQAAVSVGDVDYLLELLNRYFPDSHLTKADVISQYVGVRPLFGGSQSQHASLQSVSREHHIADGPGGTVLVAGGKYTTHRTMAREIVDFALRSLALPATRSVGRSNTRIPLGHEVVTETAMTGGSASSTPDPEGFPFLEEQLRYAMRRGMVVHLEDFYFRRSALYLARADHGLPWAERLAEVWAEAMGLTGDEAQSRAKAELARLQQAIARADQRISAGTGA